MCPCCGEGLRASPRGLRVVRRAARGAAAGEARARAALYGHALAVCAAGLVLLAAALGATRRVRSYSSRSSRSTRRPCAARRDRRVAPEVDGAAGGIVLMVLCEWLYARCGASRRASSVTCTRAPGARPCPVTLALAVLIGVTVPERLRMRELGKRAAENAVLYETDLALARYRKRFGTYPAALTDLRRLEDPDGSVARLLARIAPGEYKPEADIASLGAGRTAKSRRGRRVSSLPARAAGTADTTDAGLALTNYGLTLPGRDACRHRRRPAHTRRPHPRGGAGATSSRPWRHADPRTRALELSAAPLPDKAGHPRHLQRGRRTTRPAPRHPAPRRPHHRGSIFDVITDRGRRHHARLLKLRA